MPSLPDVLEALPIIASLILVEGLLSVDNALAIAALASRLPEPERKLALRLGILGAYGFRGVALLCAGWIVAHPSLKALGAGYLIYLMCAHLSAAEEDSGQAGGGQSPNFWMTILQIEILDLSLSVDNVVAASIMSPKLWVVCAGVFIGILVLRFFAGICVGWLQRFPVLAKAAFLLVGYVGCLLFVELALGRMLGSGVKFGGICAILLLSLAYGRFENVRRVLWPFVRVSGLAMKGVAGTVDLLLWPLRAVHRWTRRVLTRRP